ncbi:thioredoxin family protein [Herminiimonas sp. CN]|uniref:thioredoxin family protein n=1 Tax=Herminiimonas sp. CN TaxID=1349818 RepID=UPI00047381C1|nr:thioredoxin family protein [Herminiimonas sp. CN]
MLSLTLDNDNRSRISAALNDNRWVIACLCAAWCGTCTDFRNSFEELAARHPDKQLVWIDIEDQADVVGDLDIDNFPTLLIQHGDTVAFFGTILPDMRLADRLIQSQLEKNDADLQAEAHGSAERRDWQRDCNLRTLLDAAA